MIKIQTIKEPAKNFGAYLKHLLLRFRPYENFLFKLFHPNTKAVAGPIENLDYIPLPIAKGKKTTGEKIELEMPPTRSDNPLTNFLILVAS